ncbi:right-handed parallel beta-helix repeat-containing protein [Hymenobacter baengnokdamensis]|uniref:right-handed parallel beta-helix repeat-containing protein n=1 Tax=Hymenobacter baengnokdamensis TaxID=2615203 RepID=UPI001245A516|nr:right-handed parallel beta-helix repeat-containing protein [Hymenobacter baengnokdamensis]
MKISSLLIFLLAWAAALLHPGGAQAQSAGGAFSCDGTFYQVRQSGNGATAFSVLYRVDRSTSTYTTNPITGGTYGTTGTLSVSGTNIVVNGLAYNSQDGFLYALTYPADNGTPTVVPHLYKMGLGGVQDLGATNLPIAQFATGSFDKTGHYYVTTRNSADATYRGNVYRFDLNSSNATPLNAATLLMKNATGGTVTTTATEDYFDIAYNPSDNKLYGTFADNVIYRLDLHDAAGNPTTGNTSTTVPTTAWITQIGTTAGTQAIGTSFFDISGRLFAYANGTVGTAGSGSFYIVNLASGAYTKLSSIDPVSNSDGASCINPNQRIDVTKELTNVVAVSATTFDVTYTIRVRNTGTVTDDNVQVSDFLSGTGATTANTTFPTATSTTITSAPVVTNLDGSSLAANTTTPFTGKTGAASLLSGTQPLTAGQRAVITYTVRVVFPAGNVPSTPQNNTAYATSTSGTSNDGYTQAAADGSLVTPNALEANDASTNSSTFPALRADLNDVGDTPSPTQLVFAPSISGTVFEDPNYGGGLGRSQNNAVGIGRSGARVELYTVNAGIATYNSFQTTTADGSYAFTGLTAGASYVVRVVNSTVTSSRGTGGLAVQTYRTKVTAATGTTPDPSRVGGEDPARGDAAQGSTGSTFTLLTTPTVGATIGTIPESQAPITLSVTSSPAVNVDFGYNFDLVVNTNDAGQGSLRQFITNSNALGGESALAQVYTATSGATTPLTSGVETSIFMLTDGQAHAGQLAGFTSQLTSGVAKITPATALPAISGPNTAIDGTTQLRDIGNTNTATLGTGGTVGTTGTALAQLSGPEVQLTGTSAVAFGLDIASTGTGTLVQGLAIYGFGNALDSNNGANIRSAANSVTITQNALGTTATAFAAPPTANNADNVRLTGGTSGVVVSNNLIGFSNSKGISINAGVTNVSVTGNEVRSNGLGGANYDGVDIQGSSATVTNNLFTGTSGQGIDGYRSPGSNSISGNTISDNGRGTATLAPGETPGVRIYGAGNTITQNIISGNYGAGIMLEGATNGGATAAASTTAISQNAIYNNGNVLARNGNAATGQVGIDLEATGDNEPAGTSPFVTLNSTTTTGANGLLNYPILRGATVTGSNLVVTGYSKAGATIELFIAQPNPSAVNATGANFGQGKTYLLTLTEGATTGIVDANASTSNYSGNINGFNQGSGTGASAFTFSIPLSSLPAGVLTNGTLAPGTLLTSTATLANATSEFSGNVASSQLVANNVTNIAVLASSGAAVLNPNLSAVTDGAGVTISSYSVTDQTNLNGTLRYNGVAVTAATVITDLTKLTYQPTAGFSGTATFSYNAIDSNGATSNIATYTIPVTPVADVATVFAAGNPTSATASTALAFTVNFTNNGPSTAAGVTHSVQLPAGLGTVTASNGGSYNNATGLVTYSPSSTTLASAANLNSVITINSVPAGLSSLTAVSTIGTTSAETVTTNNTATTTIPVAPSFDLATTITGPTTLTVGALATYTVTTKNNGPSPIGIPAEGSTAATGAVQTVKLPTNLIGVFATNGGTYDKTTGIVTFPDVALASGQTVANTVSFSVGAATTFAVQALVAKTSTLTGTDTNAANDSAYLNGNASATNTVATGTAPAAPTAATPNTSANVYVTIAGPAQVTGGATATYTVTQGNSGPLDASGVQTQVALPTGLAAMTLTVDNGTLVNGTLSAGVISFGAAGTYTQATGILQLAALTAAQGPATAAQKTYQIGFPAPTTLPNYTAAASVSSTTADIMPSDNVAMTQTEVKPVTDVVIALNNVSLTASGTAYVDDASHNLTAGQTISYAVQATNASTVAARNVQQTVALAPTLDATTLRVNGAAGTLSGSLYSFTGGATYNAGTGVVTLPAIPELVGGATQATSVSFTIPAPNTSGIFTMPAQASISTSTPESNTANNAAALSTRIASAQDVAVNLSGPAQATIGNPVLYTVATTNNGPAANGTQTTTVTLPFDLDPTTLLLNNAASTSNASGTYTYASGATYNSATGVVTFPSAALYLPKQGLSTVNTIQFVAPDVTLLNAVANVTTSGTDLNLANNSAQVITPLSNNSNLPTLDLITTIASTGSTTVGGSRTYSVTTTNSTGASVTATNVTQTLVLPAGLTTNGGTVATTNGGVYNNLTGVVTFTVGNLGASAVTNSATFTLPAGPSGSDNPSYSLVATASSFTANPETNVNNNTATNSTTIGAKYDLAATISGPAAAPAGSTVNYAVTLSNNGPSQATAVTGSVTLPAGVTSYTLTGPTGTATTITGSGTVNIRASANLLAGVTELYQISFTAPASTFTVSSGIATTGGVAETDVAPNTASVTTSVNLAPVASDIVNTLQGPRGNTAGALALSPLSAVDTDAGSIASYTITSLPTAAMGVLYYNGSPATLAAGLVTDATKLSFVPASGFVGDATFTYTATDNGNGNATYALTSAPARYTIPVSQDINSFYATTPTKGGTNKYVTSDVLAYVIDPNAAVYTSSRTVYNSAGGTTATILQGVNGVASAVAATSGNGPAANGSYPANPTNVLPAGVSLDPATGLIYVSNAALLANNPTARFYQINVITTDLKGGINTVTAQFTIGAYPLPVVLTAFTATAVQNRDALLTWTTASEQNSDHFEVERSLEGTNFSKIAELAAQGTTATTTGYTYTDASIAARTHGTAYYRLRQVDLDGSASYSPVRAVSFTKAATVALALYPNPASASTTLDLSQLPATGTYQVSLLDATGRQVLAATLAGGQLQPLSLASLATGIYHVVVTGTLADGSVLRQVLQLSKE